MSSGGDDKRKAEREFRGGSLVPGPIKTGRSSMNRSKFRPSLVLVSFVSVSTLCGCASGRVHFVRTAPPPNTFNKSELILVGEFDSAGATSLGDGHESAGAVETHLSRLSDDVQMRLVRHLQAQGFNAIRRDQSQTTRNAIVIDGKITLNDRGSWALRAFVGFGTGATRLESSVRAYRLRSDAPLADFDVHATSGWSGGCVMGFGDFIPTDSENTAIAIANYIAEQAGY